MGLINGVKLELIFQQIPARNRSPPISDAIPLTLLAAMTKQIKYPCVNDYQLSPTS